jgi:hypothetical protein
MEFTRCIDYIKSLYDVIVSSWQYNILFIVVFGNLFQGYYLFPDLQTDIVWATIALSMSILLDTMVYSHIQNIGLRRICVFYTCTLIDASIYAFCLKISNMIVLEGDNFNASINLVLTWVAQYTLRSLVLFRLGQLIFAGIVQFYGGTIMNFYNRISMDLIQINQRNKSRVIARLEILAPLRCRGFDNAITEEPVCHVCLGLITENNLGRVLPCDHAFHGACIDDWVSNTASCPKCHVAI